MKIILLLKNFRNKNIRIRSFSDVRLENNSSLFESFFRLGNNECQNIFEIVNKTNKVFKSTNDLLRSIK